MGTFHDEIEVQSRDFVHLALLITTTKDRIFSYIDLGVAVDVLLLLANLCNERSEEGNRREWLGFGR